MRRAFVWFFLGAMLLAFGCPVETQQPKNVPRIGLCSKQGDRVMRALDKAIGAQRILFVPLASLCRAKKRNGPSHLLQDHDRNEEG